MTDAELAIAYETYRDMVFRIAYVQTKSKAQAEDIQQDVFLALVRYSDRIRDEKHLKAWLIRVAQNACKKHFRSLWIKMTVLYDDSLYKEQETDEDGAAVASAAAPGPDEGEGEEIEIVQEAVEQLSEPARAVIHLFYYEQLSVREIANALGISEANVKTRLSRARADLRQLLKERKR